MIKSEFVNLMQQNAVPLLSNKDKIEHYIKTGRKTRVVKKTVKPKFVPKLQMFTKIYPIVQKEICCVNF